MDLTNTLAAAYAAIDLHTSDPTHRTKARGLMAGYDAMYAASDAATYTVEGVEDTVTAPLVNLETGRSSRTFILAGKLDVRLRDGHGRSNWRCVLRGENRAGKAVTIEYDKRADVLYVVLRKTGNPCHYVELDSGNILRVENASGEVVGVTIPAYSRQIKRGEIDLPGVVGRRVGGRDVRTVRGDGMTADESIYFDKLTVAQRQGMAARSEGLGPDSVLGNPVMISLCKGCSCDQVEEIISYFLEGHTEEPTEVLLGRINGGAA